MSTPQLKVSHVSEGVVQVGIPITLESVHPLEPIGVMFEDDGDTGYFYGLNFDSKEKDAKFKIVDAVHIYDVKNITDSEKPCRFHILWSADGLKTVLMINSYPHAIINFERGTACCRTGFPPASVPSLTHDWDEEEMKHFFA